MNFLVFEAWGILMSCCWIVNLMLLMMDILLFLSNIFGVSVLLFTCIFIAIGNNTAGNQPFLIFKRVYSGFLTFIYNFVSNEQIS